MILLLGCLLGIGALLAAAPFLWPSSTTGATGSTTGATGGGVGDSGGSRDLTSAKPHPADMLAPLRARLNEAGLGRVPLAVFVAASLVIGLAAAAVVFVLVPVAALAIAAGAVGALLPTAVLGARARSRRRAHRALWPDVVDHLVSAVRSGLALPDGVAALAHTGPAALREQFAAFETEYAVSGNFGRSIDRLKGELADPVADRILETLRMSREVGGNELPSVLRALASHLRQEAAIRGEVEARQSWVMNAAKLGAAAPWVVLALLSTRPEAAIAYNSPTGIVVIVGGLAATIVAYRAMVALGRLPEERRWFR